MCRTIAAQRDRDGERLGAVSKLVTSEHCHFARCEPTAWIPVWLALIDGPCTSSVAQSERNNYALQTRATMPHSAIVPFRRMWRLTRYRKIRGCHLSSTKINWDELAASWFPERVQTLFVDVRCSTLPPPPTTTSWLLQAQHFAESMCRVRTSVSSVLWGMLHDYFGCTFGHVTRAHFTRDELNTNSACSLLFVRKFMIFSVHFSLVENAQ